MEAAAFFLGANSAEGFRSLYPDFCREHRVVWYLKGGPGCGKSGFMKTLAAGAEAAGLPCARILCSGDPDSLDGVSLPGGVAWVDATAPHALEPRLPGGAGLYLDLGAFYDHGALAALGGELAEAFSRYRARYAQGYELTAAAGAVWRSAALPLADERFREAAERRARSLAGRELPRRRGGAGRERRRFLSALTGRGPVTLWDTAAALAPRRVLVDNRLGLSHFLLEPLRRAALGAGLDAVVCPSPLLPDRIEHLLLPEAGLGFFSVTPEDPCPLAPDRHVRLDALADRSADREQRRALRRRRKLRDSLVSEACALFREAGALHDELEALYNPHVDFAGVYALAREHLARYLDGAGKA